MNADRRDVNAFVFTGRIRPEWTSVRIDVRDPPLRFQLGEIEGKRGEMTVLINASQFSLLVTTEKPVENLATFRNGIITVARSLFDAIGYHAGQAIDIEITSLTDLRGEEGTTEGLGGRSVRDAPSEPTGRVGSRPRSRCPHARSRSLRVRCNGRDGGVGVGPDVSSKARC